MAALPVAEQRESSINYFNKDGSWLWLTVATPLELSPG